ncbi:MAG: hypothetical protein CBR30_04975 [Dictyoglomus sp. NZ13-RE01]|nr:MAG: hypothetical protein CBR30_04975 [Dictyoglomus sp. NZ13-RE01]
MKALEKKIIEKFLKPKIDILEFPFEWGKETLYYLYYFQKGEEALISKEQMEIRIFQEWIKNNKRDFFTFISLINKIKDFRKELLTNSIEIKSYLLKIAKDLEEYIFLQNIPIPKSINFPSLQELGEENFLWEILSWYLKIIKTITFCINFFHYPKIHSELSLLSKTHKFSPKERYSLELYKNDIANILIGLTGYPIGEENYEIFLPSNVVYITSMDKDSFEIKDFEIIFYLL